MFWLLENGYLVATPLENSKEINARSEVLEPSTKQKNHSNNDSLLIVNTGGTISALATYDKVENNGVEVLDIFKYEQFASFIKGYNYCTFKLKLSEDYSLSDYYELKDFIDVKLKEKYKTFLFFHGTDRLGCFSSWIKILSKKMGFKAFVLGAQRDAEKPTWELPFLIKSVKSLRLLKKKSCYVITQKKNYYVVHDPFLIRKVDTYGIDCFYSETQKVCISENLVYPKELYDKNFYNNFKIFPLEECKKNNFKIENFYTENKNIREQEGSNFLLGTGVGNLGLTNTNKKIFFDTLVRNGPRSSIIYSKSNKKNIELIRPSFEAFILIMNTTDLLKS